MTGFRTIILDDRPEYASNDRFPTAHAVRVVESFEKALDGLEIDRDCYVVIITRGHKFDREVLEQSLKTKAGYVGMISSRRKREAIYQALLEKGVRQSDLDRVHSPIGIPIGGETPEEIAVSIVAELIKERTQRAGMSVSGQAAIILAAGYSSRMGSFKPMHKLNGSTITERLITLYRNQGIEVYLVVGWNKEVLMAKTKYLEVKIVENPSFEDGMFSSIKAGLQSIENQSYKAVFVHPVDVPLVNSSTVQVLAEALKESGAKIYYPNFQSRRGHPTLISTDLIPDILKWKGEGGLKAFLTDRHNLAMDVAVEDKNILFDIDIPGDLVELEDRFGELDLPEKG